MGRWSITSVHLVTVSVVERIAELKYVTVYTLMAIRITSVCVEEKVMNMNVQYVHHS